MPAPTPPILPQPFANNATGGTINTIPNTTATPGLASYDKGFPSITMQPVIAGGKPPQGQDFNGVLFAITSHLYYLQAGQPYLYNSTVAAAIGGYGVGTLLGMADGSGVWLNQVAGNMTNPDGGSAAGWVPSTSYGATAISTTGGSITLTPAQSRRSIVVVSGSLASNATLNFPTNNQRWLIVNNTTGSFALTVKTVAGTGVVIPQGGYGAPTEVYGNGTSLFPAVSPVVLPTDVAPSGNSIAQRSAAGYLYATYFNQSSGLENFSISSVIAQTGSDGFNRKISLANLAAQISLTQLAGQVADGQVPVSAVNQYRSTILNDSNLTGTPTAPTPPPGDSSTRVATTAFVLAGASFSSTGYYIFPGGFILNWGFSATGGVAFAQPFPNAPLFGLCGTYPRSGTGSNGSGFTYSLSQFGMGVVFDPAPNTGFWIAGGY